MTALWHAAQGFWLGFIGVGWHNAGEILPVLLVVWLVWRFLPWRTAHPHESNPAVCHLARLDRQSPAVKALRLLADGEISVGKACESLNEIGRGLNPLLPPYDEAAEWDDSTSFREKLAAKDTALAEARAHSDGADEAAAEALRQRDDARAKLDEVERERERDVLRLTCDAHITVIGDREADLAAMRAEIFEHQDFLRWASGMNPAHWDALPEAVRDRWKALMTQAPAESPGAAWLATAREVVEAVEQTICGFCQNRIGYVGPADLYPDWRTCAHCRGLRALLARPEVQRWAGR